jgi:hypothetical protein
MGFGPCEKSVDHRVWRVTHIDNGTNRPNQEGTCECETSQMRKPVCKENLPVPRARRCSEKVAVLNEFGM